ncbi:hypothetical protein QTP86_011505 [Hemibagrus guttatus]|nr:hypothetical protein QTP86_011505 [Hemibagrus guttatus]
MIQPDYQEATHLEQFVTRFLLKETTSQLQSLQSSLECAMETTAEQTRQERQDFWVTLTLVVQIKVTSTWMAGPNVSQQNIAQSITLPPLACLLSIVHPGAMCSPGVCEEDSQWMIQINRLQKLIDRLEKKHILIVQRQLSVMEDELEEFRMALRQYVDCVSVQTGSLHHLQTNYSKTFQRANVDFLETPEITTTMLVPASWWVLNNN